MSETTMQLRQKNPEETDKMAKIEDADGDVYGYLARGITDATGEYISLTLSAGDDAQLDGVSGNGSGNFATFETPGGAVVGFGIALDALEDVLGVGIERDEDGVVQNAPESIGMEFGSSTEDNFEEAESVDEDEVEGLLSGSSESEDEEDSEDEEVEISDEELSLTE